MRKIGLLFLGIISLGNIVLGQTIQVWNDKNENISNQTLLMEDEFVMWIENTGVTSLDVVCQITDLILPPESDGIAPCWGGICASIENPLTINLPYTIGTYTTIAAGQINTEDAHYLYFSNNSTGYSKMQLKYFPQNNPDDYTLLIFEKGTSSNDNITNAIFSAYPNPADDYITINYNIENYSNSQFVIYNILGTEIKKENLQNNSNKLNVDISDLNSGVYFYTLIADKKIINTKKLIVK